MTRDMWMLTHCLMIILLIMKIMNQILRQNRRLEETSHKKIKKSTTKVTDISIQTMTGATVTQVRKAVMEKEVRSAGWRIELRKTVKKSSQNSPETYKIKVEEHE